MEYGNNYIEISSAGPKLLSGECKIIYSLALCLHVVYSDA